MNDKRYKAIEKWLGSGDTNREWEAILATQEITKWKHSSYSLSDIQTYVTIRSNKPKIN
jgi:hypothetical protein